MLKELMVEPGSIDPSERRSIDSEMANVTTLSTRLKILEERYTILRKKIQVTDQNIIELEKNQYAETQLIDEDVLEIKSKLKELVEKLELLNDEMKHFADRREFTVLKKYIEFWQPMDFVTRKEVNDFLRKKLNK